MPDKNTKQRILFASSKLFNEHGLSNVRLQQIADEVGISPGNLAYHFRNKEAIVAHLFDHINAEARAILATYRLYPNLIDFDNQLSRYYQFLREYPYFFTDILEIERSFPALDGSQKELLAKMRGQLKNRIDFNSTRGIIKASLDESLKNCLVETLWTTIIFYPLQKKLLKSWQNDVDSSHFRSLIWAQLMPYFTNQGREEFDLLLRPSLGEIFQLKST